MLGVLNLLPAAAAPPVVEVVFKEERVFICRLLRGLDRKVGNSLLLGATFVRW